MTTGHLLFGPWFDEFRHPDIGFFEEKLIAAEHDTVKAKKDNNENPVLVRCKQSVYGD